jgi:hypothetical protein
MKHLKNNFKELWNDTKGLVTSAVSLVVDVVYIPVSACKDVRDAYVNSKAKKEQTVEVKEVVEEEIQNETGDVQNANLQTA